MSNTLKPISDKPFTYIMLNIGSDQITKKKRLLIRKAIDRFFIFENNFLIVKEDVFEFLIKDGENESAKKYQSFFIDNS